MAVPSGNNASLNDIQNEWGGSDPISLNEYYLGGLNVPSNFTNTGSIPTSGTISVNNFRGTSSEDSAVNILTQFWDQRASYFRRNLESGGSVWPGDDFNRDSGGGSVNRYLTTVSPAATFSATALQGMSKKHTVIYLATGSSAAIQTYTSGTVTNGIYSLSGQEVSIVVARYDGLARNRTSYSGTYSRSGGNSGSWSKMILLQGWWDVAAAVSNPTNNNGRYYDRTLPSGRLALFASGSGPNTGSLVPYSGTNVIKGTEWWYNGTAMYLCVNNTASNQTMRWDTATLDAYGNISGYTAGLFGFNRWLFELYKIS